MSPRSAQSPEGGRGCKAEPGRGSPDFTATGGLRSQPAVRTSRGQRARREQLSLLRVFLQGRRAEAESRLRGMAMGELMKGDRGTAWSLSWTSSPHSLTVSTGTNPAFLCPLLVTSVPRLCPSCGTPGHPS